MNIGQRIKEIREKTGFSQITVATYLQVDQSLVSKIEKGERKPTTDILKKLSELFGCKVVTFLNEDDFSCFNIAFRTNELSSEDLQSIALVNKIAMNLDDMNHMMGE